MLDVTVKNRGIMDERTFAGNRILITGAAGFIGYHLASSLLRQGCHIVGVDNLNGYYDPGLKQARLSLLKSYSEFDFIEADISYLDEMTALFSRVRPQIVVNLAAQAGVRYSIDNPSTYINSNIIGFHNVLEACKLFKPDHLVYASSSSVYGNQQKTPFSVSDITDYPISLYAATKKSNELMAHVYAHLFNIPCTGLRFFTVYGPYGRPDMAYFSFTKSIFDGKQIDIYNNGDLYRDFTYIDDIVRGLEAVINSPPSSDSSARVYNIGNNHPELLSDFVATLEDIIGVKAIKQYLPMQQGDVYRTFADIDDFAQDFGFRPTTDLRAGLLKFVDWYRSYYSK